MFLSACSFATPKERFAISDYALTGVEIPQYAEDEDIVVHYAYVASYNHTTLLPNWVAWELTEEELKETYNFQCSFSRDPSVEFPKASREDYSSTGWDKGHMAPRADMKWNAQALEESYFFTNICPQDHAMNSGAWRKIEELTRRMARQHGKVYVVCGPVFDSVKHRHIGLSCVHVPDRFFKALSVCTEKGYQTVGFLVANTPQNGPARSYAVSVDSVESIIGRDLFPQLPEEDENHFDWNFWKQ